MGQFASIISLSIDEIITLTESVVNDPAKAINELNMITTSLQPRTIFSPLPVPLPPAAGTPLGLAIYDALLAAYNQSVFIFSATYPAIDPSVVHTDYGTVLNYAPVPNDYTSLANQITACFSIWNLQPALAAGIAAQLQPQVVLSANTPLATYGRAATGTVTINDPVIEAEYLFWVAAFSIFQTGTDTSGNPTLAVVYSFSAANGMLTSVMQ